MGKSSASEAYGGERERAGGGCLCDRRPSDSPPSVSARRRQRCENKPQTQTDTTSEGGRKSEWMTLKHHVKAEECMNAAECVQDDRLHHRNN